MRSVPEAYEVLVSEPERFSVYDWNHSAYGEHRDIALDRAGIERILEAPEATESDIAAIDAKIRHTSRLIHLIGDRFPVLGRTFAPKALRASLSDARGYLRNIRNMGSKLRDGLKQLLAECWQSGERPVVVGHSLGSVIAYDTFWELSHETQDAGTIDVFVTLGSPLATRFVGDLLKGIGESGRRRYPTIIERWVNFAALGETVSYFPGFEQAFAEMKELKLLDVLEDYHGLYNHFRGHRGLNVHMSYGYLVHREVAGVIGEAILRK